MRLAILTVSDRSHRGEREDLGGPAVRAAAERLLPGAAVVAQEIVPDERDRIAGRLRELADSGVVDLILTTGGTGLSPRDVTPEATRDVVDREVPGLAEAMRAASRPAFPAALLSRQVAGTRRAVLIVNLPGSPRGAVECLESVAAALPHAVGMLGGADAERHPARPVDRA
jgi:molybdopterin adenylyltransferase